MMMMMMFFYIRMLLKLSTRVPSKLLSIQSCFHLRTTSTRETRLNHVDPHTAGFVMSCVYYACVSLQSEATGEDGSSLQDYIWR